MRKHTVRLLTFARKGKSTVILALVVAPACNLSLKRIMKTEELDASVLSEEGEAKGRKKKK